jgi:hypothetical protein
VFPVRYELNFYTFFTRNSAFIVLTPFNSEIHLDNILVLINAGSEIIRSEIHKLISFI